MLTAKKKEFCLHSRADKESGVSPSFDEMKEALDLNKSGIHCFDHGVGGTRFSRRLPHRARALEVLKLPDPAAPAAPPKDAPRSSRPSSAKGEFAGGDAGGLATAAAGVPMRRCKTKSARRRAPELIGNGDHYALEVKADSMIGAGMEGDVAILNALNRPI